MANLVRQLESNNIETAFHFTSRHIHDASRRFFLTNLCRQLASFHGWVEQIPADDWDLGALLRRLLARPPKSGRRIVVVVDGLDEAMPFWTPDREMFPAKLPDGIQVVFSAREVADRDWLGDLGLALPDGCVITLGPLSEKGIKDILLNKKLVSDELTQRSAEQLWTISEGDPFYLYDLLMDLRKSGGDISVLREYPIGFNSYIARWWRDGCAACGQQAFIDLMGSLAVAYAPIARDVLIQMSRADAIRGGTFRDLIERAARYLVGSAVQGYRLGHRRIAEFVAQEIADEIDVYRARFAWLAVDWSRLPAGLAREYALRFGPRHLVDAHWLDALRKLLVNADWLQAKLDATDPYLLLADFELLQDDSTLTPVRDAIRMSAPVLLDDKQQLASQLCARLSDDAVPEVQHSLSQAEQSSRRFHLHPLTSSLARTGGPLLSTLVGHGSSVFAAAVTPDGRHVISGSDDHTVRVWRLDTGELITTFQGHEDSVQSAAITPNGRNVISASADGTLKVWDLQANQLLYTIAAHSGRVKALAVMPDGRRVISGSWDLKVWDLKTRRLLRTLRGHDAPVSALAVASDNRRAVSASYDWTLKVWDVNRGQEVHTLEDIREPIFAATVTPNGRLLVSGGNSRSITVWDLDKGRSVGGMQISGLAVYAISALPDDRHVLVGSNDGVLAMWCIRTGEEVWGVYAHSEAITAIAVTPDGRCAVTASCDKTLKIWRLGAKWTKLAGDVPLREVRALTVVPGHGHLLTAFYDGTVGVWDLDSGHALRAIRIQDEAINALAVLRGSRMVVSGSSDGTLRVWNLDRQDVELTIHGHGSAVLAITAMPDGQRAISASFDQTMRIWDLASGRELRKFEIARPFVVVAMSADGRYAAVGAGNAVVILSFANGRAMWALEGHSSPVSAVALTPDGRRAVTGAWDGTLCAWDLAKGEVIKRLDGHSMCVRAIAVTEDGRFAVSVSDDRRLRVWDVEDGRVLAQFTGETGMRTVAVARNERRIIAGEESGRLHFLRVTGIAESW